MEHRIFIIEDHPLFSIGLIEIINYEEDMIVCDSCSSVKDALHKIPKISPDVIVLDITLEDGSGFEVLHEMKQSYPQIPVLILSMHHESLYAESTIMAGAKGYIMKHEAPKCVIRGIREVLAGELFISEGIKTTLLKQLSTSRKEDAESPLKRLTIRELEIFDMIGEGLTSREIANMLNLSIKTVGTYKDRIKSKLRIDNINRLIALAAKWKVGPK